MDELELGKATIVYDDPEEGVVEDTVENEQILYARDHWMIKSGTDEEGNDLMKQIPKERVHAVHRNVERFEDEAQTVRRRVESFARDIQEKIPMDVGDGRQGAKRREERPAEGQRIPVEENDDDNR